MVLALLGFGMAKAGHAGVNQVIKGQGKVNIQIYFVGLKTADLNLFKVGEKSSFTIRNQPVYPPMTIVKAERWPRQIAFMSPDCKKALAFPDPTQPLAHDFVVTIQADADITNDGYVISGNKIKIGNQVELESFKYRVQGVVVDINQAN
jgi:hypothetical protein